MKIKEISVSKKFSLGNYEMLEVGLVASVEEGDEMSIKTAVKELYAEIEALGKEAKEKML